MIYLRLLPFIFLMFRVCFGFSQNESKVWYFGNNAGLDFNTNPPTVLTNGVMTTGEGCAGISDNSGSLLFYTDGSTVYNKNHAIMANGTGLLGNSSSSQSAVIVRKPGSATLYYIFTKAAGNGSLTYSEVDITLAAGMGSVTIKNTALAQSMTEHLTSVKHCNAKDVWVIAHEANNTTFHAYLVTQSGVAATPITSNVGASFGSFFIGCMKTSPNGSKLAFAVAGSVLIEIFDFDSSTGTLSNPLSLGGNIPYPYGVEFSPDCSKFYSKGHYQLGQWDLTAGSSALIAASLYTFATVNGIGSLQLAPDGKIYAARQSQQALGVVNNPNIAAVGCNYVDVGQSTSPNSSAAGLPNFITSGFKAPYPPFTHSTVCNTSTFTLANYTYYPGVNYSVTSVAWNFGDLSSGASNTSSLNNPTHIFTAPGSYTTQLIVNYSCGTDTLNQILTIGNAAPTLSIAGSLTICAGEKRTYTVTGAQTYTWNSGPTSSTITLTPSASTNSFNVVGTGTNGCTSKKTFTVTVNKCTSLFESLNATDLVKFYPNPAYDQLHLETSEKSNLLILNLQGMILYKNTYEPGNHLIDLLNLEDGIYQLRITNDKGNFTRNLVKITR